MSYSKGRTLFRPWGDLHPDGSMTPWRDNDGNFGVSWLVQDDVSTAWGKDFKFTAFTRCDDEANWPTGSPLQLLYDEVKFNQQYKPLLERVGTSWPLISAPRHSGILKGLLVELNGKSYKERPIWGVMIVMPPSAREALDDLLNTQADAKHPAQVSADDPYGWNSKYYVGDPIGVACGKVFEFNKESAFTGAATSDDINVAADGRTTSRTSDSPIEKYACRVKGVLALPVERIRKYDEAFTDQLWFMTGEEQINNLIIRGFGNSHRELVLYVFGGKNLLPASFEFGRATVDMAKPAIPKGQPQAAPAKAMPAREADDDLQVNLEGDQGGEDEPPFDAGTSRPAGGPVFTPEPPVASEPKVSVTADNIRARLAAAGAKGKA
jgi:hypothetical protein